MSISQSKKALSEAITICGGQSALARLMNPPVTPQAVQKWSRLGVVPIHRAAAIEVATDRKVTREQLRPDIFNKDS